MLDQESTLAVLRCQGKGLSAPRRECTADRLYGFCDVDIAARVDDQVSVFGEWVPGCSELVFKYREIGFRRFVFARCTLFDA
jgi:hypothetical protein